MENARASESEARSEGMPVGEEDLLRRLERADPTAFDELVVLYRGRVARLAYRLLGWDSEAEDVVQDVFLAAWKHLKKFRRQSSLWTWLAAVTVNRCRSLRRRRFVRLKFLAGWHPRRSRTSREAGTVAAEAETLERVSRAVRALPTKLREVAVLRYLEEMSIEQVAAVLKISRNAVDVRLHRARSRLRDMLSGLIEEEER